MCLSVQGTVVLVSSTREKLAFNPVNNIPVSTSIQELVDIPVKPLKETVVVGRPAVKCEVQ